MSGLADPAAVQRRLDEIEEDLATRQNELEAAPLAHFRAKRNKERAYARAFLEAEGTVAERTANASRLTSHIGVEEEGAWEGKKAVVRVLDTRAAVGMAVLKAQGRVGS